MALLAALALAAPGPAPGPSVRRPAAPAPRRDPGMPDHITLANGREQKVVAANTPGALTLLYGDDHAFGLVAPEGWVIDDTSGLGQRIRVVLYPRSTRWKDATTIMYESCYHAGNGRAPDLGQVLARDADTFRQRAPKGQLKDEPPVALKHGGAAKVRTLAPTGGEPLEAIAYVAGQKLVVLLVLHSEDAPGFRAAYPKFRDMVGSFQLVAENIQTPTTDRR